MGYIRRHADEDIPAIRKIATMMIAVATGVTIGGLLSGILVAVNEGDVGAGSVVMAFFAAIGILIGIAAVTTSAFDRLATSRTTGATVETNSRS